MKTLFGATLVAVLTTCVAVPFVAFGQQKTVKECRDEWRASTDAAKGTQKDYVAKCRGEGTAAAPAARPAGAAAKTAKECRDEWRASKDATKGTQKDYVAKCRGEAAAGTPAAPAAGAPAAAPPAAGAKTARACRDEWRASTDPNKGTQKDYVAKCRGEAAAGSPAAPAAGAPAAAPPATAAKTVRACRDEWRASKDPAKGTEKDYVAKCRAGPTTAAPAAPTTPPAAPAAPAHAPPAAAAPAPAPAAPPPSASTPAPAPAPSAAAPARPAAPAAAPAPTAPAPTGANQYQEEAQAKAHCPADIVVWVNLNSHIYHFSGNANYGRHFVDKGGAYMCEKDALSATFRAAENEKRP
jgi:hypothetical protein